MFDQHPLIPLIFCCITIIIIIKQCLVKRRFLKIKALSACVLAFVVTFILVFYNDIGLAGSWLEKVNKDIINWILFIIDILVGILLLLTLDFSFTSERVQQLLNKSIEDSKYYVVLDKKDRVKNISTLLLEDLDVDLSYAYNKNFFDLLERKYRIIGFNGQECLKNDIKMFYSHYETRAIPNLTNKITIDLQDDQLKETALYFHETTIFSGEKYKGRILMGDKKNEENLIGMERELSQASTELNTIKNRFVTILGKTNDGVYFNDITNGSIWVNDILVSKLVLNGNSMDIKDFYKMIHPDDLPFYEEKMKSITDTYSITYRFNTGSYYVYLKEEGQKISNGKTIELCGIMTPIDNYSFAKTDTLLDSLAGEPEMLARLSQLENVDKIFEVVHFRVESIPQINSTLGRAIGNTVLSQYVGLFKQNFVNDNQIYRIDGLEFVAFITDYRKMDILKNNLHKSESLLHIKADYINTQITAEVFMGISRSDDHPSRKKTLERAKEALRFARNPQFNSNFAFYKDIK